MKGLLIKDLKILAKQKKSMAFVLLFLGLCAFAGDDATFSATYTVVVLSMLTLNTISYDEKDGGMMFLLSLPANRKTYVKEKYIFAFINLLFSIVLAFALGYVPAIVKHTNPELGSFVMSIMAIMFMMGMGLAMAIPLDLKLGAEKGRMFVILAVAGMFLITVTGYKILKGVLYIDVLGELTKLLSGVKSEVLLYMILAGSMFAVLLLMLYCSYLISNKVMEKKEF